MDTRITYRSQQPFYQGFSLFPLRKTRRYNHFIIKVYSQKAGLNGVFRTERNKEVLDANYIIAIRRKIATYGVPQTRGIAAHIQLARQSLLELLNLCYDNRKALVRALEALRSLDKSVHAYKDAQHRLRGDLKLLLTSNQVSNPCCTTSEDIQVLVNRWQQMSDEIESAVYSLMEFNRVAVAPTDHAPVLTARIQVDWLVAEMRKILQVKGMIIHLLYGWKALREEHERQEMLN